MHGFIHFVQFVVITEVMPMADQATIARRGGALLSSSGSNYFCKMFSDEYFIKMTPVGIL